MARLWLVACGLRLGYFRRPQVTCCLKLGPSCASTSKTCGQRFGVPQASAKLFTPGKSVRDRGTNSLTPGPTGEVTPHTPNALVVGPGLKGVALCWVSTTTPSTRKDLRISIPQFLILYKHLTIFCQEDNIG